MQQERSQELFQKQDKQRTAVSMRYHIVSDNTYFLMGVSHAEEIREGNVSIIKIPRDISRVSPSPGDVFVLYIPESGRRSEFIRRFSLHLLRVVILVDSPVFRPVKKYFPWVMSAAISLRELFSVIRLAEMAPARYRKASGQAARIISLLTAGVSVRDAAEKLNVTRDYVYRVSREEVMRYGIPDCNRVSLLICRDINDIYRAGESACRES
ncbi:hypothetical protein RX799_04165 [Klebsiella oxytoca]|uniref:hypothetical protein n=1 Tax=Klebsiella oxytoca TaxID=571 RepID=UPI00385132E7